MYDHSRAVTLPWGFSPAEVVLYRIRANLSGKPGD
jgi:hypothetical protein